jgi:hypothetical protein
LLSAERWEVRIGPAYTMSWTLRSVLRTGMSGLVRLRGRLHDGVEVPVRPKYHRPVTEGYCVVATRGGELPEVNCQSVTKHHRR